MKIAPFSALLRSFSQVQKRQSSHIIEYVTDSVVQLIVFTYSVVEPPKPIPELPRAVAEAVADVVAGAASTTASPSI